MPVNAITRDPEPQTQAASLATPSSARMRPMPMPVHHLAVLLAMDLDILVDELRQSAHGAGVSREIRIPTADLPVPPEAATMIASLVTVSSPTGTSSRPSSEA